ncbi:MULTISPECIES: HAD hydrolase-like protein [Bradyrhizobium]
MRERCFMVGDQFDRDVQSAMAAGFLAFYFPGTLSLIG